MPVACQQDSEASHHYRPKSKRWVALTRFVLTLQKRRGGFETRPYNTSQPDFWVWRYAFPASFNPRSTFSGLNGSLLMRTPVALKIALPMQAIGGTQAISPAPLAP